jgi:hypothetical protein
MGTFPHSGVETWRILIACYRDLVLYPPIDFASQAVSEVAKRVRFDLVPPANPSCGVVNRDGAPNRRAFTAMEWPAGCFVLPATAYTQLPVHSVWKTRWLGLLNSGSASASDSASLAGSHAAKADPDLERTSPQRLGCAIRTLGRQCQRLSALFLWV